jgi:spermidine/putrescine ABC transporter ATP-binding subunit
MQAADVELEKIGKRYGEQWVVRNIDLHIQRGEFFTFLGPSGCGKTTLLRIIAGFVEPDAGLVLLDGQAVNQVPPWRRDIGMVFQSYALWPHLTVFENVAFGLRERKVARAEINQRVTTALKQVELQGTEARRPSQLSGGQQQRVALARTLVIQPRVLLLDEPLSNLDARLRIEMRLELLKLQRDLGLTTIYVTHDQEEALAMSTQIAVIDRGRVVQQGKPREIYETPADDFVAAFIGQSNLLTARIDRVLGELAIVTLEGGMKLTLKRPKTVKTIVTGDAVIVSVRPEAIELIDTKTESNRTTQIEGKIVASAYQGAFVEYEIAALGKLLKARVTNPKEKPLFERGDEIAFSFAAADVTLIAAER